MSNTSRNELVVALSAANNMLKMWSVFSESNNFAVKKSSDALSEMIHVLLQHAEDA